MVVVIIAEWFSENMGYVENKLPQALAQLGCEVHVVTSDMQIYATDANLYKIYEPYLGPPIVATGTKRIDGYTLHRIPHYITRYGIGLTGLHSKFQEIKPEVIYLFEINTEHTLQVIKYKKEFNYKIFTESRLHLSIYTPPRGLRQKILHYFSERAKWKSAGLNFEKCYPIAPDVLFVITKYFGQRKSKCVLSSLAVDTNTFKPVTSEEEKQKRFELRKSLGFREEDIVCIYTGRFTDSKGPIILAKAIDHLQKTGKTRYKGFFLGTGDSAYEESIKSHDGCVTHPFVKSDELVSFYQAADIGIWPKQESTSQFDAIACGLPIIISSAVHDLERINGNGLSYQHEDPLDLATKIDGLESIEKRKELGANGVVKIKQSYSWDHLAKLRLKDFKGKS